MTTLVKVSNLNHACVDIDLLPETDALIEQCKGLLLQDANQVAKVDDLLITFPTTSKSLPLSVIERVLVHYKPTSLTLACNKLDRMIRSFTLDLAESRVQITTHAKSEKMTNSCTERFDLPPTL